MLVLVQPTEQQIALLCRTNAGAASKTVLGRAAGAMGSLAKGYLLTGAVASLGLLAATAYSSSSSSSSSRS